MCVCIKRLLKLIGLAITSYLSLSIFFGSLSNFVYGQKHPNILLFYADDQGTLDAGVYGAPDIQTPNIDLLASEGVKFTQAYAHSVCCPSRAALLTGRSPQRCGVNDWTSSNPNDTEGSVMKLDEITLAEHLKTFGYKTGLIGKWHLGATVGYGPLNQGFDYFFGFKGGFIDYYSHFYLHSLWQKPPFHDLYRGEEEIFEHGEYFPDMQVREANKFLEENIDNPFFLYVPFSLPHYPEQPDSTFIDQYKHLKWPRSSYAPMIATLDNRMGKILSKLNELGLRENTIVIYISDNGHSTEDYSNWGVNYGSNGGGGYTGKWRGAKASFFEGGLRVPFIISFPRLFPEGATRGQAVVNLDIFPTLCDILDIPLPENKLDGKSLLPIIDSDKASSRHEAMYWMWQESWAVSEGNWKLIYKGWDTTGKYSDLPVRDAKLPKYYLAKIDDEHPEEINYASQFPELVKRLETLHKTWLVDVFEDQEILDSSTNER